MKFSDIAASGMSTL